MGTVELSVIGPALILLACAGMQLGLWMLGREVAHDAARKGATAAAAWQAGPGDGLVRAAGWLRQVGVVKDPAVSAAGSSPDRVRITVTGRVVTLVPGWHLAISQSAERPVERLDVP